MSNLLICIHFYGFYYFFYAIVWFQALLIALHGHLEAAAPEVKTRQVHSRAHFDVMSKPTNLLDSRQLITRSSTRHHHRTPHATTTRGTAVAAKKGQQFRKIHFANRLLRLCNSMPPWCLVHVRTPNRIPGYRLEYQLRCRCTERKVRYYLLFITLANKHFNLYYFVTLWLTEERIK